ncbi:MAG: labile enterotoxin outputA [wastewater metagenome]|nr:labile enterotoxin outputA [Candidatus Loosdrechtia aerotolerans]
MIESFIEKKQELLGKLKRLNEKFYEFENSYELDLSELKAKVNELTENLAKEKFSIALVGAFAEGKSTIVSAITERLDIKIAPEPSTCDIMRYEYDDWLIVDTPGLFSEKLLHDELTRKYISEANIVIYTLDPVNPLKNSHQVTIKWLLSDINKINSTIFVINKMDERADLEDEEDYKRISDIKIEVVVDTLKQIIELKSLPKIVCVSGDPYGYGLKHWFENLNEYKKLSRIENLCNEINRFIKSARDRL